METIGHVVPCIADGNPSAMMAAINLAAESGLNSKAYYINVFPAVGGLIHGFTTNSPKRAENYTSNTDERRLGPAAMAFSRLVGLEFRSKFGMSGDGIGSLEFFQEYPLLGLDSKELDSMEVEGVRLVVPDSFPKISGIKAVDKHKERAKFAVWNTYAQQELEELGLEAELVAPFILEGLRPDNEDFDLTGDQVIVKSSGSGIPKVWWDEIRHALFNHMDSEVRWSMHGKKELLRSYLDPKYNGLRSARILSYYRAFGSATELMICYGSEQVEVGFEMWRRGVPVRMVLLPPRGSHEDRNIRLAIEAGIAVAQLRLPGAPNIPNLEIVEPKDINSLLTGQRRVAPFNFGFLGREPLYPDNRVITARL